MFVKYPTGSERFAVRRQALDLHEMSVDVVAEHKSAHLFSSE
jgi:hypothetical protein